MKQLPPAIQENHRYLLFKVHGENKGLGEVVRAVWNSTLDYMGVKGSGQAETWIIGNKFNKKKQEGIVEVKQSREDDLRAALTVNNGFEDETFLSIEKTSGTIENLKQS